MYYGTALALAVGSGSLLTARISRPHPVSESALEPQNLRIRKMHSSSKWLLLLAFLVAAPDLAAEETVLTLQRSIDIALGGSYTVQSYLERKQATRHDYLYYRAMFKPRLDFTLDAPSWDEMVSAIPQVNGLPVYNSIGSLNYGGRLQFTYPLPTGGNLSLVSALNRINDKTVLSLDGDETLRARRAQSSFSLQFEQPIFTRNTLDENLDEAKLRFEKASHQFTRQQIDIIYRVTRVFYQVFRSTREVEIAQEKLSNSEEALRVARLKSSAGRIPEGDVLIQEVTAAEDRAALAERRGDLERNKDELKQLIGISLYESVKVVADLKYDSLTVDPEEAIRRALANRLEMREAELDCELGKINLDRARRVREVSGKISAYYDITGVSTREHGSTTDLFNSSFDNLSARPPNRGITLSVNVPVFDWGRGRERVQEEISNLRQVKLNLEDQRNSIIREVRDIVRTVHEASLRLHIHEQNQQIAERSYQISRLRFENGGITSQDLALAQVRLATSKLNYLDAFISYQLALAELKKQTLWDFGADRSYQVETSYQTDRSDK